MKQLRNENRVSENAAQAVCFENVSCRIGRKTIIDHISLDFKAGQISGIVGPNGAGKTTLLSMVLGLRPPSEGTVTVLGERLPSRGYSLRRRIGVVLQETALYEELTGFENLLFSASLYNIPEPKKRINAVLELLDLSGRSGEPVRTLSGGLRRRIAIARALLHKPEMLIIDEPTLGVDVEARHAVWSHLRLLKSEGTTVLTATNYLDEAQALCDKVTVIRSGRLLVSESPDSLIARAGSCLDIECDAGQAAKIISELKNSKDIIRIDQTPAGLSIFLKGNLKSDNIVLTILKTVPISGFRIRPPDLAEVFRSLEAPS